MSRLPGPICIRRSRSTHACLEWSDGRTLRGAGRHDHTVCKVTFVDRDGHLHAATVRVSQKLPLTRRGVTRILENQTGLQVREIFNEYCTTARRSKSHALPRRAR